MAIGERIHFFRMMRGMTQKYLGMALGFPEKSADVRLAQYENGFRTPKADVTAALAQALDVSPKALDVPDIDSYVGLMHTLPVTRTSQFFTHFLSGFGLLSAGNLLIFLLSALAMMPSGSVDWAALGLWLLVTELLELFFLSLGTLCAMATGWLLAIPVL